jgi:DNA-binding NarL/FixJ family response regulator
VTKAKQLRPDIVVMDIGMPSLNGLAATSKILQDEPRQRVLILTVADSEQLVREVLEVGALADMC